MAGLSCDAPFIGDGSKLSTSLLQPPLHVGKQSAGAGGWVAWAGKAGITGGSDGLGTDAQPDTSSSSIAAVSSSAAGRSHGPGIHLGDRGGSPQSQQPGGICRSGVSLRPLDAHCVTASPVDATCPPGQHGSSDGSVDVRTDHCAPRHAACASARRLTSPPQRLAGLRQSLPWNIVQRANSLHAPA